MATLRDIRLNWNLLCLADYITRRIELISNLSNKYQ